MHRLHGKRTPGCAFTHLPAEVSRHGHDSNADHDRVECKIIADEMPSMIMQVKLDEPVCTNHRIPESAQGMGLWCAARGTLGH